MLLDSDKPARNGAVKEGRVRSPAKWIRVRQLGAIEEAITEHLDDHGISILDILAKEFTRDWSNVAATGVNGAGHIGFQDQALPETHIKVLLPEPRCHVNQTSAGLCRDVITEEDGVRGWEGGLAGLEKVKGRFITGASQGMHQKML